MNARNMVIENILQYELQLIDLQMTGSVLPSPIEPNYGVSFPMSQNERLAIVKDYLIERINNIQIGETIER